MMSMSERKTVRYWAEVVWAGLAVFAGVLIVGKCAYFILWGACQ